jgi:hypothetical protein
VKKEKDVLEVQIKNITEVNEALIEDITTLNEMIAFIIPGVPGVEVYYCEMCLFESRSLQGLFGKFRTILRIYT